MDGLLCDLSESEQLFSDPCPKRVIQSVVAFLPLGGNKTALFQNFFTFRFLGLTVGVLLPAFLSEVLAR